MGWDSCTSALFVTCLAPPLPPCCECSLTGPKPTRNNFSEPHSAQLFLYASCRVSMPQPPASPADIASATANILPPVPLPNSFFEMLGSKLRRRSLWWQSLSEFLLLLGCSLSGLARSWIDCADATSPNEEKERDLPKKWEERLRLRKLYEKGAKVSHLAGVGKPG